MTTWMIALAGGVLIGLAATLLLWLNGRVAGVSGILNGVIFPKEGDTVWRAAFLIGLIVAGGLYMALAPGASLPRADYSPAALIAAGLLVGFGTRMGNGCTSGHGVCGLGRLSLRSFVAVLTFMATAIATTFVVQARMELKMGRLSSAALASGALFGLGLAMSGMTDPRRVLGFLDLFGDFDPTLLFVLGGAVMTTAVLFRFVLRRGSPVLASTFQLSNLRHIDRRLLGGAALFGIGWGIAGYCPGPALAGLGIGSIEAFWFVPAMIVGMLLHRAVNRS